MSSQRYYLTTAIDYVNGFPHLGHAYEKVLADVMARYQRALGKDVFFLTGVDEHGQKVQQSAQKKGQEPIAFCDEMAAHFRSLCDKLEISYSRFARTTEAGHKEIVRAFEQKLKEQGDDIYFEEHEGFYSVRQEQFVTEKDRNEDGTWPEIFGEVVSQKEPNYYFRLSNYQGWLKQYLLDNPNFITPSFRQKEVIAALAEPVPDLCISRPKSRLSWGIPLPFDEEYVTYVWFDALINYVSFANHGTADDRWPADAHVIGKDILIPAHAVYWPMMLKALGLPLPKQIVAHGWWTNKGAKMSKSTGNSVDPIPYIEKYGPELLRFFVSAEMTTGYDADFSDERLIQRNNSDLANNLGNLVSRTISMIGSYREGIVPAYDETLLTPLEADLRSDDILSEYRAALDNWETHKALQVALRYSQRANQYIEETQPFKMKKDAAQTARLDVVLAHLAEAVRRLAILIAPVMPTAAARIQTQLGYSEPRTLLAEAVFGNTLTGQQLGAREILFPKYELEGA